MYVKKKGALESKIETIVHKIYNHDAIFQVKKYMSIPAILSTRIITFKDILNFNKTLNVLKEIEAFADDMDNGYAIFLQTTPNKLYKNTDLQRKVLNDLILQVSTSKGKFNVTQDSIIESAIKHSSKVKDPLSEYTDDYLAKWFKTAIITSLELKHLRIFR